MRLKSKLLTRFEESLGNEIVLINKTEDQGEIETELKTESESKLVTEFQTEINTDQEFDTDENRDFEINSKIM